MSSEFSSFDEFFRCQFGRVVGFLMKTGFDLDEARDASAEAMLRAYEAWSSLTQPRAWTYKTAHRIAVRKARRDRDGVHRAVSAGWGVSEPIDPCAMIDDYAEVLTVLAGLSHAQRLVMSWRLHDFTPREIADQLGMNEVTVRSHIRHARTKLRKHFDAAKNERLDVRDQGDATNGGEVIDDAE